MTGKAQPNKKTRNTRSGNSMRKPEQAWWEHEWWVSWIFLTIAHSCPNDSSYGPVRIDCQFVGFADFINCAIPSAQEIESSVNRLTTLGLVRTESRDIYLTELGDAMMVKIKKQRRSIRNQFELVDRYIRKCEPLSEEVPRWHLREAEYMEIVRKYQTHTAEIAKKTR